MHAIQTGDVRFPPQNTTYPPKNNQVGPRLANQPWGQRVVREVGMARRAGDVGVTEHLADCKQVHPAVDHQLVVLCFEC